MQLLFEPKALIACVLSTSGTTVAFLSSSLFPLELRACSKKLRKVTTTAVTSSIKPSSSIDARRFASRTRASTAWLIAEAAADSFPSLFAAARAALTYPAFESQPKMCGSVRNQTKALEAEAQQGGHHVIRA